MTARSDVAELEACWHRLLAEAPAEAARAAFADLVAAYGAPARHYHGIEHIATLLRLVEAEAEQWQDRAAVELAVLFHDAVYDVGRTDNEPRSAALAADVLGRLGVAAARAAKIASYITATAHMTAGEPSEDADLARFLDLDLSVLAAAPQDYDAYARAIRREYAVFPDAIYREGRIRVLRAFLARAHIFLCLDHQAAWEGPARANLQWELSAQLQAAVGPLDEGRQ